MAGTVALSGLGTVPVARRDQVLVASVTQPLGHGGYVLEEERAYAALKKLARRSVTPVLTREGRLAGLFHQESVRRWLQLSGVDARALGA